MIDNIKNNNSHMSKLLLVEDDKVAVDMVIRLVKNKYICDYVYNGEDALIKAYENDYEAFLIDIGLPGDMDGVQTVMELKKIKNFKNKPYIAVTAYALPGDKESFLNNGLTHYISKPFELRKLEMLIEKVLKESN